MSEVFDKVKEIIVDQLDVEESAVTMEASFNDDLEADSLDVVELVMDLEDEFDLEIADEDVEQIKTVGDSVNYINDKQNQNEKLVYIQFVLQHNCIALAKLFIFI